MTPPPERSYQCARGPFEPLDQPVGCRQPHPVARGSARTHEGPRVTIQGLFTPPPRRMGRSFPRDVEYVLANGRPRPANHLHVSTPGRADEPADDRDQVIPEHQPIQKAAQVPLPCDPLLPRDGRVEAAVAFWAVEVGPVANAKFGVADDQRIEHVGGAASRRITGSAK